jgi:hypothetical protein
MIVGACREFPKRQHPLWYLWRRSSAFRPAVVIYGSTRAGRNAALCQMTEVAAFAADMVVLAGIGGPLQNHAGKCPERELFLERDYCAEGINSCRCVTRLSS